MRYRSLMVAAILATAMTLSACPAANAASPPKLVRGTLTALPVSDSAKVTATCSPNQLSDTLFTVKCRNVVIENGVTVATFDLAMNATGFVVYAHAPVTGVPGTTTTISVTLQQFGVNRSGQLSNATSQTLTSGPILIADGAPSAPKGVGGTIKFCPGGVCGP